MTRQGGYGKASGGISILKLARPVTGIVILVLCADTNNDRAGFFSFLFLMFLYNYVVFWLLLGMPGHSVFL